MSVRMLGEMVRTGSQVGDVIDGHLPYGTRFLAVEKECTESFRRPSEMKDVHGFQLEDLEDLARDFLVVVDDDGVKTRDLDEHVESSTGCLSTGFCQ